MGHVLPGFENLTRAVSGTFLGSPVNLTVYATLDYTIDIAFRQIKLLNIHVKSLFR